MRAAAAVVVGIVIGAVGALTAQKLLMEGRPLPPPPPPPTSTTVPTAPPSPLPAAMCEAVVRIWLDDGKPTVTPKDVCLARNRELTWDIDPLMMAGQVDIDFDLQGPDKGPFRDKTGVNPHQTQGRGKYVRKNDKHPIRSNAAEKIGRWTYTVTYTPQGGQPMVADPAVCVRD